MLLRRITKHVKDQNWFAVMLDFLIVVVGILIAFQITNWNEARSKGAQKEYYLTRLESDLSATIAYLSDQKEYVDKALIEIDVFADTLNNLQTTDEELVAKTRSLLSEAYYITDFKTFRATFDDLNANGNLEVLDDEKLIVSLAQLHTDYADKSEDSLVNTDWVNGIEVRLTSEFDMLQFDRITAHLFPEASTPQIAQKIRASEDLIRRSAALHYWYNNRIGKDYAEMIARTQETLTLVQSELKDR